MTANRMGRGQRGVLWLGVAYLGLCLAPAFLVAGSQEKSPLPAPQPKERLALKVELKRLPKDTAYSACAVVFSPDGKTLAAGLRGFWGDGTGSNMRDGIIQMWDVSSGKNTATLPAGTGTVSVIFFPDGKTLAATSAGRTVLWDVNTGKRNSTIVTNPTDAPAIGISADGKTLSSGGVELIDSDPVDAVVTIKLWNVATGKSTATLRGHTDFVSSLAFSPDGKTLVSAACGKDPTIRLWDVASGENTAVLYGHKGMVESVKFSPDGKTLASGGFDDTVRLWDVTSRKNIATMTSNATPKRPWLSGVKCVAFSPDGKTVASGAMCVIKFWDVASGKNTAYFTAHTHWINSIAFGPDGKTLASGSTDGTIKLWDMPAVKKADK